MFKVVGKCSGYLLLSLSANFELRSKREMKGLYDFWHSDFLEKNHIWNYGEINSGQCGPEFIFLVGEGNLLFNCDI